MPCNTMSWSLLVLASTTAIADYCGTEYGTLLCEMDVALGVRWWSWPCRPALARLLVWAQVCGCWWHAATCCSGHGPRRELTAPSGWCLLLPRHVLLQHRNVVVRFEAKYETRMGQRVVIVGGNNALGNWNPEHGLALTWSDGHIWKAQLTGPKGSICGTEFKVRRCGASGCAGVGMRLAPRHARMTSGAARCMHCSKATMDWV